MSEGAKRGGLGIGQTRTFIHFAQACHLKRTLQLHLIIGWRKKHRKQQLVISSIQLEYGKECFHLSQITMQFQSREVNNWPQTLKPLQEKYREQHKPLYKAFIDLTKAFDFVSRDGLFKILKKIGCPPTLLSMISSFHENTHSTIRFDCTSS